MQLIHPKLQEKKFARLIVLHYQKQNFVFEVLGRRQYTTQN